MTTHLETSLSWVHQPPAKYQSLEESAEQVSELFASTIASMAADVQALKHLTTWKEILEDSENDSRNPADREEFLESLCDLDDIVSAVEKKVSVLRNIVSEEQRALENLNLLHRDSQDQNENLQYLVERCRNMKVTHKTATAANDSSHHNKTKAKSPTKATVKFTGSKPHAHTPKTTTTKAKPSTREPLGTSCSWNSSSHEHHAHVEGLSCYIERVTVEELETVPRTTRGRVQVQVLNEALENFETLFHKKAVKQRKQLLLLEESRHASLSQYYGAPEEELEDETLLQNLVVTEQELRKSCAFFAAGEGTARTVLAVLKAMRRIKQVPQKKKGQPFTYKLCLE